MHINGMLHADSPLLLTVGPNYIIMARSSAFPPPPPSPSPSPSPLSSLISPLSSLLSLSLSQLGCHKNTGVALKLAQVHICTAQIHMG